MIAVDYFLYDNRTPARWGRDWGVKAATGALASRADLKADFDRYCGAVPNEQGRLSGFGEAIGGLRRANGYLLCVTLECADFIGRPSWAVFGLWCADAAVLETVLGGDPIRAAKAALGAETLPAAIEIQTANGAISPTRRGKSTATTFHRFDVEATVREVRSLLLGAVRGRTALPNVLGITATSRLSALAQANFDLVYCHPFDDKAEHALARHLSPPELNEPWIAPAEPMRPPVSLREKPSLNVRLEARSPRSLASTLWLVVGGTVGTIVFLIVADVRRYGAFSPFKSIPPKPASRSQKSDAPPSRINGGDSGNRPSTETVLLEIGKRLKEFKELDPGALRDSPGFQVFKKLDVKPQYKEKRKRIERAYAALLEVRDRMVKRSGPPYVAYYFDEDGRRIASALKWQKITQILEERPLGMEDCAVLKDAFGFEFKSEKSTVRRWCDSLAGLETTIHSLSANAARLERMREARAKKWRLRQQVQPDLGLVRGRLRDDADVIDLAAVAEVEERVGAGPVDHVVEVDDLRVAVLEHDLGEAELRGASVDLQQHRRPAAVDVHREVGPAVLAVENFSGVPRPRGRRRERRHDDRAEDDRREVDARHDADDGPGTNDDGGQHAMNREAGANDDGGAPRSDANPHGLGRRYLGKRHGGKNQG
jgi:hypothetical protein